MAANKRQNNGCSLVPNVQRFSHPTDGCIFCVQDMFPQFSANLQNGRQGGALSRCRCENIFGCYAGGDGDCVQKCDDPSNCNPNTGECTAGQSKKGRGSMFLNYSLVHRIPSSLYSIITVCCKCMSRRLTHSRYWHRFIASINTFSSDRVCFMQREATRNACAGAVAAGFGITFAVLFGIALIAAGYYLYRKYGDQLSMPSFQMGRSPEIQDTSPGATTGGVVTEYPQFQDGLDADEMQNVGVSLSYLSACMASSHDTSAARALSTVPDDPYVEHNVACCQYFSAVLEA